MQLPIYWQRLHHAYAELLAVVRPEVGNCFDQPPLSTSLPAGGQSSKSQVTTLSHFLGLTYKEVEVHVTRE